MPQPVAEIEAAPAVVAGEQVAVLIEIGDVAHLVTEAALVGTGHVVRGVELDLAEARGEGDLLGVGQRLIAEHQHGIAVHAGMDRRRARLIERGREIDVLDLARRTRV